MSMLSKKITRVQRREGGGFGFGAPHREQPRAMLLGAFASDASAITSAVSTGADVVIVRGKDAAKAITQAAAKDCAVGAWVESLDDASAEALHAAGCDFVVSSLGGTAATAVDTDRMGQVIAPEEALDDTTLRALGPMGLDAIFIGHEPGPMTLRQQLEMVKVASFASTPLLVTVAADAGVAELRVLRDSGTAVVVAPDGTAEKALSELGERLRQVPTPRRGRDNGREMAIVPSTAGHHDEEDDEPEEI
jgi:2-keto-3-deoxy-L-rhamnonate aldolase RhmA